MVFNIIPFLIVDRFLFVVTILVLSYSGLLLCAVCARERHGQRDHGHDGDSADVWVSQRLLSLRRDDDDVYPRPRVEQPCAHVSAYVVCSVPTMSMMSAFDLSFVVLLSLSRSLW